MNNNPFSPSLVGGSLFDARPVWTWQAVAYRLSGEPPGTRMRIEKYAAQHPRDGGLRPSIGLPVGQKADFRLTLPDCRGLHVQDFETHYEAHIDRTDPSCDALVHLRDDAPEAFVVTTALVGGLVGLLLGRSGQAFAAGLLIGAGAGGLTAGTKSPKQSPPVAPENWRNASVHEGPSDEE